MGANGSTGPEAVAYAEKNAALLTARAGARDPSAIPSICRISAALQYPAGKIFFFVFFFKNPRTYSSSLWTKIICIDKELFNETIAHCFMNDNLSQCSAKS